MSRTATVVLGEDTADFVAAQLRDGRYASESEVVSAALKLLKQREAELQSVRDALIEGEESGEPQPFDFDAFLSAKRGSAS